MTSGSGFRVEGADEFDKLAAKLRRAEKNRIRRALTKGLREMVKPVGEAMVRSGAAQMPKRGGLAGRVERSRIASTINVGSDPKVVIRLRTREGYDLNALERGIVRHPVFGRRAWVTQRVPAGGFSAGFRDTAPRVRDSVATELERVVREIGQGQ